MIPKGVTQDMWILEPDETCPFGRSLSIVRMLYIVVMQPVGSEKCHLTKDFFMVPAKMLGRLLKCVGLWLEAR